MRISTHGYMRAFIQAIAVGTLAATPAWATVGTPDDSDLSGAPGNRISAAVPLELHADEIRVIRTRQRDSLQVEVLREDHGQLKPVDGLRITVQRCAPGGKTRVDAELSQSRYAVTNGKNTYRIIDQIPCSGHVQLIFRSGSNGSQALGIWSIARIAELKLQATTGLSFWKAPIKFVWPAEADYYNWGEVHISRGDHWDVVGHELGHAIYDLGDLGDWGGGQHKIDECYSTSLALSEGWASFFSAWLSVDAADGDAKFEYMVPRRAPIRFETIPADVCRSEKNEWRVTGFFWDLYDLHEDGEKANESFARMWKALSGSRVPSSSAARARLRDAGLDPSLLELAWVLNF